MPKGALSKEKEIAAYDANRMVAILKKLHTWLANEKRLQSSARNVQRG